MRSRRDQLQAYQFLRHRIVSALLSGEPESVESPMRRIVRTSFAGLMVAVIALAAFGIVGLLRKGGSNSWRGHDTLLLEKETDAVYVWLRGRLYPMQNYTSARLLLGSAVQQSISRRSLAGVPRMAPHGIVGAPNSLPAAGDLVHDPWTVCAGTFGKRARVTLFVGASAPGDVLPADAGALVTSGVPGDATMLVWRGHALRIPARDVVGVTGALFAQVPPVRPVGAAWLNALPRGPDLGFPDVPDRGAEGPLLDGRPTRVGQVFGVHSVGRAQYFVMLADGLAPVTQGAAALLQADPQSKQAYPGGTVSELPIGADVATNAPRSRAGLDLRGYPDRPLNPVGGTGQDVLCTSVTGTTGNPTQSVRAVAELPDIARSPDGPAVPGALPPADLVYLPPGSGAIARAGASRTLFLVTGNGTKFPIADDAALAALGYAGVRVSALPADLLSLLPTGPTLSRQGAGRPVLARPTPAPTGTANP